MKKLHQINSHAQSKLCYLVKKHSQVQLPGRALRRAPSCLRFLAGPRAACCLGLCFRLPLWLLPGPWRIWAASSTALSVASFLPRLLRRGAQSLPALHEGILVLQPPQGQFEGSARRQGATRLVLPPLGAFCPEKS